MSWAAILNSGRRLAFTEHGVNGAIGKIFVAKKYLVTSSVFKLQKWILHQNGVEFNQKSKSDMCTVWKQENQKLAHTAEISISGYDPLVAHSVLLVRA